MTEVQNHCFFLNIDHPVPVFLVYKRLEKAVRTDNNLMCRTVPLAAAGRHSEARKAHRAEPNPPRPREPPSRAFLVLSRSSYK